MSDLRSGGAKSAAARATRLVDAFAKVRRKRQAVQRARWQHGQLLAQLSEVVSCRRGRRARVRLQPKSGRRRLARTLPLRGGAAHRAAVSQVKVVGVVAEQVGGRRSARRRGAAVHERAADARRGRHLRRGARRRSAAAASRGAQRAAHRHAKTGEHSGGSVPRLTLSFRAPPLAVAGPPATRRRSPCMPGTRTTTMCSSMPLKS